MRKPIKKQIYKSESLDEYNRVREYLYKKFDNNSLPSHYDANGTYWSTDLLNNGVAMLATEVPLQVAPKARKFYQILAFGFSQRRIGQVEKKVQEALALSPIFIE